MNFGVSKAKPKLAVLLDRACRGEDVVITRHGEPIARLVPINAPTALDRTSAVRAVRALKKRLNVNASVAVRKLIDAGRG